MTAVSENFTISITDANGVAATQSLTITVSAAPSITTTTLPGATQTGAYSQTVAGTGGTNPYAWSVTSGILPSGLTLNASTGVISGTVGASAVSETFTVTLTDANGVTATKSLTITVSAAPSITHNDAGLSHPDPDRLLPDIGRLGWHLGLHLERLGGNPAQWS